MFTRHTSMLITLFMSLIAITLAACGSVEIDMEAAPTTALDIDNSYQPPSEIMTIFQITVEQLQSQFPDFAPLSDADWEARDITPAGLVGSSGYRFTIDGWQIDITYPIVAPESMIYNVSAENSTSDLQWEATMDPQGRIIDSSTPTQAVAWPGRVIGGAQADDLLFEITGEVGTVSLASVDAGLMDRLQAIRDDTGPQSFVHLWGTLSCSSTNDPQCTLEVTRIRSGTEITEPEPIGPWEGVLFARTGPPASGGDDWFTLMGDWPIQYGIWAMDEALRTDLEALRDTNQVVRIWGDLIVGIPDWNGTQIQVTSFELVE